MAREEQRVWAQLQRARFEFDAPETAESPTDRALRLRRASEQIANLSDRLDALWKELAVTDPDHVAQRLARAVSPSELLGTLNASHEPLAVVELFVGSREVIAFVLDGSSEPLRVAPITATDDDRWADLVRLAGEATAEDPGGEIAGLLAHPAMKEISEFLHEVAAGRTLLVVPHGLLHGLPIHLQPERGGQIEPRSGTHYLPTASLLRVRRAPASDGGHVMVAGDPLGDLDFAHVECADVGRRFDVEPTMGSSGDTRLDRIAARVTPVKQGSCTLRVMPCSMRAVPSAADWSSRL